MSCRIALIVFAAMVACANVDELDDHPCPEAGTTLTFATFGGPFFDTWCMSCHDEAPAGITFVTPEDVQAHRERIFVNAAAGNTFMPPGPDDPPRAERDLLAEWLACGAPE